MNMILIIIFIDHLFEQIEYRYVQYIQACVIDLVVPKPYKGCCAGYISNNICKSGIVV